jgi:hypothetical protein
VGSWPLAIISLDSIFVTGCNTDYNINLRRNPNIERGTMDYRRLLAQLRRALPKQSPGGGRQSNSAKDG